MHPFGELSARRQRLGAALRRLRKAAGLSGEQIARRLRISQSRVSRIELGEQAAAPDLVKLWLQAVQAPEAERPELIAWAEDAATEATSWRKVMPRGLAELQRDSQSIEQTARTICNFQTVCIPGLLQVPDYARRVFAADHSPSRSDIAAAVAARMERQIILFDDTRRFEFVLAEAALYWRLAPPSVMRVQIDRLTTASELGNVTLGVIPRTAEACEWHDHGFNILDDRGDDGDPIVHVETLTCGLTITDPADVATYKDKFARLGALAATGEDARDLLNRAFAEYRAESG